MNNYFSNETAVLACFRLRTPRRKKRMVRHDRDKHLLALFRELINLQRQKQALGWIELNPPVTRGWKRYFVLSKAVAQSTEGSFFKNILDKINSTQYSHRKDFKVKKQYKGKKRYVSTTQELYQPGKHIFTVMNFSEAEQQFFTEVMRSPTGRNEPVMVFTQPWRFALRVSPNIIYKTKVRSEAIEKRIAEIDNYLKRNALWGRIRHLLNGTNYNWYEDKDINPFKNKPLTAILDACYTKEHNT